MKKIKLFKRFSKQSAEQEQSPNATARITNETVAEYRERILAGGRKFKYPMHHNKRRIVTNSILIVIVATAILMTLCWWQLYQVQTIGKFTYGVTQIVPFPVAQVDGAWVRYSDYLMELRSATHYLASKEAVNFSSDDGKRQLDYQKRLALNKATENTYAAKLAREHNIQVSNKEVDDFIKNQTQNSQLGVTEAVYRQVIEDYYGWSFDEYKHSVYNQLLRKKVVAKIDTNSLNAANDLVARAKSGVDFAQLAREASEDPVTKAAGGDLGFVPKNSDDPSGLLKVAVKLQPGQVSDVITGADGYYIVKLLERRDSDVHIAKLFIAYKEFDKRISQLRTDKKIHEYITVTEAAQSTRR